MFEGWLSPMHIMIVGIIAILLFGDRLPEVMRSLGKGVSEFKKGMQGFQGAMNSALESTPQRNVSYQDSGERGESSAPRFQPPTSPPKAEGSADAMNDVEAIDEGHASHDHATDDASHTAAAVTAATSGKASSGMPAAAEHGP
ncbi:MAG TPA: twin-arginine translocase TatA/TatE family subunit [Pirellulales bacterium]|jgi:sec-independent protein translocase protein TatA